MQGMLLVYEVLCKSGLFIKLMSMGIFKCAWVFINVNTHGMYMYVCSKQWPMCRSNERLLGAGIFTLA